MKTCLNCGKSLKKRDQIKYCSNACQSDLRYGIYIKAWLCGVEAGDRGIETKNFSAHVRRYLREKSGEKCSLCGWDKKHVLSGTVPLEIDHIDGDSNNNKEGNLRLLCPNCHSLTLSYKNRNKGNGRIWRKDKYMKSKI